MKSAFESARVQKLMHRLAHLRLLMKEKRLTALFVTSPQNVTYLSGFRGLCSSDVLVPCLTDPEVVLLVSTRRAFALADGRYETAAKNLKGFHFIRLQTHCPATIQKLLRQTHCRTLGVEYDAIRANDLALLKKTLRGMTVHDASQCVPSLRRTKDPHEIATLAKACRVTDRAFSALVRYIRIGMTEGEVAQFLITFFHRHADSPSFAPIVASGKGAAIPHYCTSKTKKIRKGEMLLLDFGAKVGGYHADMSRTIFLGKASPRFRTIYALVRNAQERALAHLSTPGVESAGVDAEVRKTFREARCEKYFLHSTGHGVGLQIHEAPSLSPRSRDIIEEESVFTVEPGLYFPDWGGVRIEDTVVMTKHGKKILTRSLKEIIEIKN